MGIDIQKMHEAEFEADRQARIDAHFKGGVLQHLKTIEEAIERIVEKTENIEDEAIAIREKLDSIEHRLATSMHVIQELPAKFSNLAVPLWIIIVILLAHLFK
ncbi:hypothetical protein [Burkholderia gladioli]|uniref:hypothetical protein n=1 Tax=Burkholderia gladioli TaxID=28095 RepID=UPI001640ABF9|nr:hypothetical protein [Burkholderia gladioli]